MLDPVTKGYITQRPASAAQTLVRLDDHDIRTIFMAMPPQMAVSVLEHMAPGSAAHCLQLLPQKTVAGILAHTPMQVALSSMRLMKTPQVNEILNQMPATLAANLRIRLHYAETVIGAYIDSDVVTFNLEHRVGDALRLFRREGRRTGNSVNVLDENEHVAGQLYLNELLNNRDRTPVRNIMQPAVEILQARAAIQTVRTSPAWLSHDNLPVVNRVGVFQGVLRRDKIMVKEQQISHDVNDQLDTTATRTALADIFWMVTGSIFVGNATNTSQNQTDDPA